MRRSWSSIFIAAAFVAVLATIGVMQYRWLTRISESDGEKARVRVQEQADKFAADFNREIQNAYFNFQTDAESWKKGEWNEFNERYDFWLGKTAYPELISDIHFFENTPGSPFLKYDRSARVFVPADADDILIDVRQRSSDEKTFRSVYDDLTTLILPIHSGEKKIERILIRTPGAEAEPPPRLTMPRKYGFLVIRIDRSVITGRILPDLTAKHFADGDFKTAVAGKDGSAVFNTVDEIPPDATAALLDLSPENWLFFGNRDLMTTIGGEKRQGVVLNSRVDAKTFSTETSAGEKGTVKIEVKRDAEPRTSIIAERRGDRTAPWNLQVRHASGSLDTFIAANLRRNLAIGFGLLFVLAASILLIVISSHRAKMFARRQVEFVSSVSHEFRTPLAVIYSAGENLADGVASQEGQVARYGELIKGEGKKLSRMVEQILQFAGANSGRRQYSMSPTSVGDIVADAISECRPLIDEKQVEVETSVAEHLPAVSADRPALTQALQNLIVNSIKYSNGSKWIRVTAENGGGSVRLSVEDRGIGVSRADFKQIFEPFYRSREVVDAQIHGNGLGLAIVRQVAEAHGGTVRAESEPGRGSKFIIEIPQIKSDQ